MVSFVRNESLNQAKGMVERWAGAYSPNREIALAISSASIGGSLTATDTRHSFHGRAVQIDGGTTKRTKPERPRVQGQADCAVAWTSGSRNWSCRTPSWPAVFRVVSMARLYSYELLARPGCSGGLRLWALRHVVT
jgi:hypothetical protein